MHLYLKSNQNFHKHTRFLGKNPNFSIIFFSIFIFEELYNYNKILFLRRFSIRKLGKLVLAALVGAMILACASCKTEDNSVSGATYKLTSASYTAGGETTDETSEMGDMTITFNADGTATETSSKGSETVNWTQDGSTVTITETVDGETETTKLTVSSDGSILTYTESGTDEESGETYSMTMTFTRQ